MANLNVFRLPYVNIRKVCSQIMENQNFYSVIKSNKRIYGTYICTYFLSLKRLKVSHLIRIKIKREKYVNMYSIEKIIFDGSLDLNLVIMDETFKPATRITHYNGAIQNV